MKFTLSWLRNFVSLEGITPTQLADKLTMLGLEVDAVEELYTELDAFITCRVQSVSKHPNADKLTVCLVETGEGEPLEVVCGAPNVRAGLITALARPGVKLPDGTKIKKSKVRGLLSQGMLCSASELGLSSDHSGIMELDPAMEIGLPLATALGLRDTMIEVDLTPNRPDCASVLGIAREVAGFSKQQLSSPVSRLTPLNGSEVDFKVVVEDEGLCPRYIARKVSGVTVGPSPDWMQRQLLAVGMRPINNIVDVTNYVMLEMGQPLHAFDFATIRGKEIVVRSPRAGEKEFVTLDGNSRQLSEEMLMICDQEGPIAVAGVMGGLDSEVSDQTTEVLLEAACFDAVSIRRTARNLNIPSEASYRFERGVDPDLAHRAIERAAELIAKYGQGTAEADGIDVYPGKKELLNLQLRADKVRTLLGIEISKLEMADYLRGIDFEVSPDLGETMQVTVPSFRIDIEREVDLVEEIARLVGYNEIPTTQPKITMHYPKRDSLRSMRQTLSQILTSQGFYEAINYSFVTEKHFDALGLAEDDQRRSVTRLLNPLSEEQAVMRSMLLPGLLENIKRNINFQQSDIRLFEIGKTFFYREEGQLPLEKQQLCGVICGNRYPNAESLYFSDDRADFFDIKGVCQHLITTLRLSGDQGELTLVPCDQDSCQSYCDPSASEEIRNGDEVIGIFGMLDRRVLEAFGIKVDVFLLEIDLDSLSRLPVIAKQFQSLPKFPSVKRDIALLVPDHVPSGEILQAIHQQKQKLVESTQLFDVYRGKPIEEGLKSVALSVTYRSATKTLNDKSVDKVHQKIVDSLMTQFKARYREGSEL
ncbi:phenylalanine--tRNA ligase subunit beta [Desulfogranum mediterraneum]|uniref:phenylalanine--tRNA ligase subunit beta n=1 Tax=Desulfogranum mediterraneum TaxID=160661 RepID=UPI000412597A|nr:phenylalanine--tRNA ligase subunit beta [Desulfogranum mediterraneum]